VEHVAAQRAQGRSAARVALGIAPKRRKV
jgi:hypothetical protein